MPKRDRSASGPGLGVAADPPAAQSAGQPAQATGPSSRDATGVSDPAQQRPHLGADLQAMIGQQLRAAYHEILNEPVPDRFVRLLEELGAKEAPHS